MDLQRWTAAALTVSMSVAMVVVSIGVAVGLLGGQGLGVPEQRYGLLTAIADGSPGGIVLLGLVVLTLTPLAHIAAAATSFARSGERRYLLISLALGGVLLGSLAVAATTGAAAAP